MIYGSHPSPALVLLAKQFGRKAAGAGPFFQFAHFHEAGPKARKKMETKLTIRHCDYSNMPGFARLTEEAWGHGCNDGNGVAVLPNAEVMGACLRAGGKRSKDVTIHLIYDGELYSAYQVDLATGSHPEWGEVILIDAYSGEFELFEPGAGDDETAAEWAARLADLPAVIA